MLVLVLVVAVALIALWAGWLVLRWLDAAGPTAALPVRTALAVGALAVAVGALAIVWLHQQIGAGTGVADWDEPVARFAADHTTGVLRAGLKLVTQAGSSAGGIVVGVVVVLVERRRSRVWPLCWFLALVIGGASLWSHVVKAMVERDRPSFNQLVLVNSSSFPSGHSTMVAAAYAGFALVLARRRPRWVQAVLAVAALVIALAVAASRVMLGVHWLTDVLAGLSLGWTWFSVAAVAIGTWLLRLPEGTRQGS